MLKHYIRRTIKKIFALPLWIIFNVIHIIAKPLARLLRLVAFPGTILGVVVAAINYFNEGFSLLTTKVLIFALAMAIGYAVAPYLASAVYSIKTALKRAALRPIVVRPPVRFTCESI